MSASAEVEAWFAAVPGGRRARIRARHPGIKTGKGCINLRDRDELPLDDLRTVVRHAIEQPKG